MAVLAACQPQVPDSGAGVGFQSYNDYQTQREAELIANGEGGTVSVEPLDGSAVTYNSVNAPNAVPRDLRDSSVSNGVGISAENDFGAVSSERSIEEDAARVAANRQAYTVIEPTAVAPRPMNDGATLVEFALSTSNRVGQPLYSRLMIGAESRFNRNCAKYPSPDVAQEAFLNRGGPERDPMGIDPDGDGFACYWDPAPFRLAAQSR